MTADGHLWDRHGCLIHGVRCDGGDQAAELAAAYAESSRYWLAYNRAADAARAAGQPVPAPEKGR